MKKQFEVDSRECPLCHNSKDVRVQIVADEKLWKKLGKSWGAHMDISCRIIKEMVEKGILDKTNGRN